MRYKNIKRYISLLMFPIVMASCEKQLSIKPNNQLAVPQTVVDFQALLDYPAVMFLEPGCGEASADNFYVTDAGYNAFFYTSYRALYTWEKDHQFEDLGNDWGDAYKKIYYCNTVLDGLKDMKNISVAEYNNVKGQALFKRGTTFWHIATNWSLAYDSSTADKDLGIPLRLDADFTERSVRSSVKASYDQLIKDLKESVALLPILPLSHIRPSRPAAYAMLSRVYLSVRDYKTAKLYADSALALFPALMDYNTISSAPTYPFAAGNPETILSSGINNSIISVSSAIVDSNLYALYSTNDLRKILFFKSLGNNQYSYRESYLAVFSHFSGIASDELYLTRAECLARQGQTGSALADLNTLLAKRYKTGTFIPVTAGSSTETLSKILIERRKELTMRMLRWMDIKRLNKEGANIILKRFVEGKLYTLLPNDLRYALSIPEDVIAISGMQQNPR